MADLYKRKVTLELTDVEVRELTELAARADMTAGELLSAFVHDLCRSEWRNGSDESDRAEDWYDRTGFAYGSMSLAANLVQEEGIGGIITLVDALESQQMYREDPESWKEELEEVDGNEEELEFVRDIEKAVENLPKGSDREEQLQKCRRIMEEFRWMNEKGEAVNFVKK